MAFISPDTYWSEADGIISGDTKTNVNIVVDADSWSEWLELHFDTLTNVTFSKIDHNVTVT